MKENNIIVDKSKAFALEIIKLYKYLILERREHVLSRQILRSGTSIVSNIKEAIRGQSAADFYSRLSISLKEASETEYWLELLYESDYITKDMFTPLYEANQELLRILMSITKHQHEHTKSPRGGKID